MIFISTRSEHRDSPWCEPITPPTLFARGGRTSFDRNLCLASTKKRVLHLARHKSQITNLRLLHTNTNEMWEHSNVTFTSFLATLACTISSITSMELTPPPSTASIGANRGGLPSMDPTAAGNAAVASHTVGGGACQYCWQPGLPYKKIFVLEGCLADVR
jgi:hypothetical protein